MTDAELKALFIAHHDELKAFLSRNLHCQDTAADLVQDTFLRVARHENRSVIGDIRAYLFRCARNLMIDHQRKEQHRRHQTLDQIDPEHEPAGPALENAILATEHLERVQQAIQAMPRRSREVFLLSRFEGLTYVAIGERLGISSKTAFGHMVRALELLEEHTRDLD